MVTKPSSELKKQSNMIIWTSKSSSNKLLQKIKVTKAESNIKLIPIEKKFFKLCLKSCT